MGATVSGSNNQDFTYERPEPKLYAGRCIQVVELGTHPNTHPQAKSPTKKELMLVFELSNNLMQDGRPFTVNKRYTASLGDRAILRKDLESWRGRPFTEDELKGFALSNLLDKPCMINIGERVSTRDPNKKFATVTTIVPMMEGLTLSPRHNELIDFGIDDIRGPEFLKLWPWVQKTILESEEGKASGVQLPEKKPDYANPAPPETPAEGAKPVGDCPF